MPYTDRRFRCIPAIVSMHTQRGHKLLWNPGGEHADAHKTTARDSREYRHASDARPRGACLCYRMVSMPDAHDHSPLAGRLYTANRTMQINVSNAYRAVDTYCYTALQLADLPGHRLCFPVFLGAFAMLRLFANVPNLPSLPGVVMGLSAPIQKSSHDLLLFRFPSSTPW